MKRVLAALMLFAATPGAAQTALAPPPAVVAVPALSARLADLLPLLAGGGDPAIFSPEFRAQVPDAQVRRIATGLVVAYGKPQRIAAVDPVSATVAHARIGYERGTVAIDIAVDPAAPGRITGLRITGESSLEESIPAIIATLSTFPGTANFALATLGTDPPALAASLAPDRSLAVGSAFKLAILAELIRATNAGERHWTDPVKLDGAPLPGGFYATLPAGTATTLRDAAGRMIAASDNSAADLLLRLIGRERIEAMLPVIGWQDAARNRPLLSTLELYKLKAADGGRLGQRWQTLDEPGRRALLAGDVAATPLSAIDEHAFQPDRPLAIDRIEWFASAADLIRTMDWIRRNTEGPAGVEARAILSGNPGIGPASATGWAYVGYKGGSEPGVIDMTLLLQAKDGGWHALSAAWNNPTGSADERRFVAEISRAAELAAATPP